MKDFIIKMKYKKSRRILIFMIKKTLNLILLKYFKFIQEFTLYPSCNTLLRNSFSLVLFQLLISLEYRDGSCDQTIRIQRWFLRSNYQNIEMVPAIKLFIIPYFLLPHFQIIISTVKLILYLWTWTFLQFFVLYSLLHPYSELCTLYSAPCTLYFAV